MLKTLRLVALAVVTTALMHPHAQAATTSTAPQGINYQSVARNAAGQILANQPVHLLITIHDSTSAGAIVYQEHHQIITNAFGTFSVVVGGGSIITGNFGGITWGNADKYLQADMDFTGGNNYAPLGTTKLQSVAYALYAGTSAADIKNIKYDTTGVLKVETAGNIIPATKPVWVAGGNSGLTNINNWIGTIDSRDVIIKQGNEEAIRYTKGGALLATGSNAGVTPAAGPGKRMEWIPAKGAFRAGTVTATQWDDAYIGSGSNAFGTDAIASGVEATAIGSDVKALDSNAVTIGKGLISKGANSVIVGAYNDTTTAPADTTAGDKPIFQVGSGSTNTSRGNALTVQRDGDVYASQLIVSRTMNLTPTSVSVLLPGTLNPQTNSFMRVGALGLPILNIMNVGNGRAVGQLLVIQGQSLLGAVTGAGIRLVDNSGNLRLTSNMDVLSNDTITLLWDGTSWVEVSRSKN